MRGCCELQRACGRPLAVRGWRSAGRQSGSRGRGGYGGRAKRRRAPRPTTPNQPPNRGPCVPAGLPVRALSLATLLLKAIKRKRQHGTAASTRAAGPPSWRRPPFRPCSSRPSSLFRPCPISWAFCPCSATAICWMSQTTTSGCCHWKHTALHVSWCDPKDVLGYERAIP